ncbi:hypothetical protein [Streptomyces chryseus]
MAQNTLPDDLAQAQYDWGRTYSALAARHPGGTTALRRRLLLLSNRIFWHPFWSATAGYPLTARVALCQQAPRTRVTERAAP